jgi:peptidoglycan-associated lipoprotein
VKKILLSLVVVSMVSGCALFRNKNATPTDAANNGGAGVTSETTATGATEKVDSSMNFAASGSDSGSIEGLQTVHFEFDSSVLTDTEQKKLEGNAEWMAKNSSVKMLVEGHCDQKGSTEYNLSLGERRANAVKQMLIKQGVASNRISTTRYGKEKLIASGDSEEEMARNRRANFVPVK